jgi:hypothetical protein
MEATRQGTRTYYKKYFLEGNVPEIYEKISRVLHHNLPVSYVLLIQL